MRYAVSLIAVAWAVVAGASAQPAVDVSAIGPQPGAIVPPFSAPDQDGRTHTLQSVLGPKGAMLVFSRSADW